MKKFFSVHDVPNLEVLVQKAIALKRDPFKYEQLGKHKTIGLVFLNASLRTRMSTQIAAERLGLKTIVLNVNEESWKWDFRESAIMNIDTVEHIKDAAAVLSTYCDIIGLRCFAGLQNKEEDVTEHVYKSFEKYASVPVVSLESATLHPFQSLADCITIEEHKQVSRPKVVLSWAPHVKALPQAVANSFAQWMQASDVDFVITHPKGYDLDSEIVRDSKVILNQKEAIKDADFIYFKNWSSFTDYGKVIPVNENWLLQFDDLLQTNEAKVMHCMPVRRNVEMSDSLLDSKQSLIYKQAENRIYAAQIILKQILENND